MNDLEYLNVNGETLPLTNIENKDLWFEFAWKPYESEDEWIDPSDRDR